MIDYWFSNRLIMGMKTKFSRRFAAVLWLAAILPGAAWAEPTTKPATLETVTDRSAVQSADLDRVLTEQWVAIHLAAGQSQPVWGAPVTSDEPSTVIAGCSSEYQFCLVTDGRASRGDLTAEQGQVMFWPAGPGKGRVMQFSGRDLQHSLQLAGRNDLAEPLNTFSSHQDTKRWWGLVRPMSVNIGAPLRAGIDSARKSYLMQPEVVRLRHAAPGNAELPALTADAVLGHLKAGRASELSQLLSPEWFIEPAKRNELSQARLAVATTLIAQPWTKQINDGSLRATEDANVFWFSAGKENFVLTLKPFDEMVYVSSIQPQQTVEK